MTTQTLRNPCSLPSTTAGQAVVRKQSKLIWLLDLLVVWNQRSRMRRRLEAMPDYLLSDMGISRADVAREADKPFWND